MSNPKLSPKHVAFIQEYLSNGMNATDAYRKVYPKNKNPDVDGPALLGKPGIQAEIQKHQVKVAEKFNVTQESIIKELHNLAFGNFSDVMDWNEETGVSIKNKDKISAQGHSIITSIKVKKGIERKYDAENDEYTVTPYVKEIDVTIAGKQTKREALELLGKHIGMWKDKDAGHGTDKESRTAIIRRVQELYNKRKK